MFRRLKHWHSRRLHVSTSEVLALKSTSCFIVRNIGTYDDCMFPFLKYWPSRLNVLSSETFALKSTACFDLWTVGTQVDCMFRPLKYWHSSRLHVSNSETLALKPTACFVLWKRTRVYPRMVAKSSVGDRQLFQAFRGSSFPLLKAVLSLREMPATTSTSKND